MSPDTLGERKTDLLVQYTVDEGLLGMQIGQVKIRDPTDMLA